MAKTSLIALHRIGVGKPKGDGTISYVEPGKPFELEADEAAALIASGAAKAAQEPATDEAPAKKAPAKKAAAKKAEPAPEPEPDTPATDPEPAPGSAGDDGDESDLM